MNTKMNFVSVVLLVFLVLSGQVQSSPQTTSTICRGDTAELYRTSLPINKQNAALSEWTEIQRSTPENVCTTRSSLTTQGHVLKTSCVMDYVNATDSSDWCLNVPDTLYIETTFIYKCSNYDNENQMYYTIKNRPACYPSSCYDGYDQSILENSEQATFTSLVREFSQPNTDSEWLITESGELPSSGAVDGFDNCVEMRLEITEPIVSDAVAGAVGPPTVSPAPTFSPAPTYRPTISFAPTETPVPTRAPMDPTCENESVHLVSSVADIQTQFIRSGRTGNQIRDNGIAKGLSNIEGLLMIDTNTGMGFEKHCTTADDSQNFTALCDFDYDDIIEFVADSEDSISRLCQNANGIYVEDSVSIECTSDEDPSLITRINFKNKPSCRSKLCNADGVRRVATTEFDRWMKLTLEEGLDQAFAEADGDDTVEILSGPQTCVIISGDDDDDEEELVEVAVLGSTLSNIGGEPIPPTEECQAFTDVVDGTLVIYNQKAMFQRELLNYIDIDMREICGSTTPGLLECDFDWTEVLVSSESSASADSLKSVCMPDGNGSSGAGQYVESSFEVKCVNPDNGKALIMTNTNVPGCVGRPCTPGQAEYIFDDDYTFLAEKFIADGWDCTTEVHSVFAPHFNPFLKTYDLDEAQATMIRVDEYPDPPIEGKSSNEQLSDYVGEITSPREGVYAIDKNPPTLAPTGDAFHRGQNFGALFRTQAPSPAYFEPVQISSSYTRFPGMMTVLLVLPMTLSMIIF